MTPTIATILLTHECAGYLSATDLKNFGAASHDINDLVDASTPWKKRIEISFPDLNATDAIQGHPSAQAAYYYHLAIHNAAKSYGTMDEPILALARYYTSHLEPEIRNQLCIDLFKEPYFSMFIKNFSCFKMFSTFFPKQNELLFSKLLEDDALFKRIVNNRSDFEQFKKCFPSASHTATEKMYELVAQDKKYFVAMRMTTEEFSLLISAKPSEFDKLNEWYSSHTMTAVLNNQFVRTTHSHLAYITTPAS